MNAGCQGDPLLPPGEVPPVVLILQRNEAMTERQSVCLRAFPHTHLVCRCAVSILMHSFA